MNKQPEITDATRTAFIDAFCWYYASTPIEKITVKVIANKAGYSRATFYNYFKDPYDLLEYIQDDFISMVFVNMKSNVLLTKEWNQFTQSFLNMTQKNEGYSHVFLNGLNTSSFIEKVTRFAIPMITDLLRIPQDNLKARYAVEFYISGVLPVLGTWLKSNKEMPAEELSELIKGILQDGILEQLNSKREP